MGAVIRFVVLMLNQFFTQVTLGTFMFSNSLRKKDRFRKRVIVSFVVLFWLGVGVMYAGFRTDIWIVRSLVVYVALFALVIVFLKACYDEKNEVLLVSACCGYMAQHVSSQIIQMFYAPHNIEWMGEGGLFWYSLRTLPVYFVVYPVIYFFFGRRCRALHPMYGRKMLVLSLFSLAVVLALSSVRDAHAQESVTLMVISRLFSMIICGLLLYIRAFVFESLDAETENEILKQINAMQKKQFEENKENIELVNIKCHDMRHQIAQLANPGEMQEIERVIDVYDAVVKTGNSALDTLLTSKSMYCTKHDIRPHVMVDQEAIGFMSAMDICTMFGNAVENAIEAVMRIEEKEDRIIAIRARQKGGMAVINIDNNYSGNVRMQDGLPSTSKEDNGYHGFGTKSIIRTAEKYNGSVTITVDDMYHLAILMPMP